MIITYVIPCGGAKLGHAAPARDLYTGKMFKHTLANVERLAARDRADGDEVEILIMSAHHGLVDLDTVLEPYECKIDSEDAIDTFELTYQANERGLGWDSNVYMLLPIAYRIRLVTALELLDCIAHNVYEGSEAGIGEHRRVNCHIGA